MNEEWIHLIKNDWYFVLDVENNGPAKSEEEHTE